ncbi:MAG TPA: hypothetical protein VMM76_14330 [Pirellulaceae bacterium]|nr:hypothetical protein [Pirellulaceae bacterium]
MSHEKALARLYARDWWEDNPDRVSGICDRCNCDLKRSEGCLICYMGVSLICESCFDPSMHDPLDYKTFKRQQEGLSGAGIRSTNGDPAFSNDIFSMEIDDVPQWLMVVFAPILLAGIIFGIWAGVNMSTDGDSFAGGIIVGFFVGAIIGYVPVWSIVVVLRIARRSFH